MSLPVVFMFSGQGSQYHGMGRELFEADLGFREELLRLDAAALRLGGGSVLEEFMERPRELAFERLRHTHPAVYLLEVALTRRLLRAGVRPACVLGASLGEFAALVAADVLDANDALRLVHGHARAVEESCPPGGMIAIFEAASWFERERALFADTWLAAVNFGRHFVVSGARDTLVRLERDLRQRAVTFQRLPVEYAFHSPLVAAAEPTLVELASSVVWRKPSCRIASCAMPDASDEPGPERARGLTARPIQFADTIERLERDGPWHYVDLGPSGTLATFLKYLLPRTTRSRVHALLSPQGSSVDALERLLSALRGEATFSEATAWPRSQARSAPPVVSDV